jgi:hypothetical protein
LSNCTLYIDGSPAKSSTSGTVSSNLTSGSNNDFTYRYTNNNNSRTWLVECMDLNGVKTNSSQFNFNVYTTGSLPKTKIVTSRGGQPLPSQPVQPTGNFAVGDGQLGTAIANWWWVGAIIIAIGGFIWWKEKKK